MWHDGRTMPTRSGGCVPPAAENGHGPHGKQCVRSCSSPCLKRADARDGSAAVGSEAPPSGPICARRRRGGTRRHRSTACWSRLHRHGARTRSRPGRQSPHPRTAADAPQALGRTGHRSARSAPSPMRPAGSARRSACLRACRARTPQEKRWRTSGACGGAPDDAPNIASIGIVGSRRQGAHGRRGGGGPMRRAGGDGSSAVTGAPAHAGRGDGTPTSPAIRVVGVAPR